MEVTVERQPLIKWLPQINVKLQCNASSKNTDESMILESQCIDSWAKICNMNTSYLAKEGKKKVVYIRALTRMQRH